MEVEEVFEIEAEVQPEANVLSPLLGGVKSQNSVHGDHEDSSWPGQAEFKDFPWWKRPSILWLLPPQLLYTLAFGGIIVPKLNLIKNLICRDYLAHQMILDPSFHYSPIQFAGGNDQCRIPAVQSRASQFMLVAGVIGGCLSAITSPKLGALSDRYGRTRLLIVPTIGGLVGELITIYAATNPETFALNWMFLGFVMDGLCGSFTAAMAISYAYAADCTPPSQRNVAFGYFHGVLFTGIALGPLIAGVVVKATGNLLSIFYFALACHLVFLSCLSFIVPESLAKSRQHSAREKYLLSHDITRVPDGRSTNIREAFATLRDFNLLDPLKILYPTGPGTSPALRRNLILLSAVDTIMFGVAMGAMTVVIYYTDYEFGWSTPEQSFFISIVNCCRVFCLVAVLPLVTRVIRGSLKNQETKGQKGCDNVDVFLIRLAAFIDALGYLGYTLARTGPLFILSGCLGAVGGIGSPSLQSALTKHLPHDQVGQLLGANGLLHALARVVSPVIFNGIYSVTVGKFTQTVFLCLSVAFFSAFVLSWGLRKGVYLHDSSAVQDEQHQIDEVVT